jgi:ankyrin repeat protein
VTTTPTAPKAIPPASQVFTTDGLRRAAAAAETGDVALLRTIVASGPPPVDLDEVVASGVNLLMYEIVAQNETAVRALLDVGADPNALTPQGASPMLVAGTDPDPRWLRLLLDHRGDPDLKNQFGNPLLAMVVASCQWPNLFLLLDRGAAIDAANATGQTATMRLGALHQWDQVHAMLERGADPTLKDANGLALRDFLTQRLPPDSPQEPWRDRVAARIGASA